MPAFTDVVVAISLKSESNWLKADMHKAIKKLGGNIAPTVHKNVTFLIGSARAVRANTQRVRKARKYDIPIVTEKFLETCIEKNELISLSSEFLLTLDIAKKQAQIDKEPDVKALKQARQKVLKKRKDAIHAAAVEKSRRQRRRIENTKKEVIENTKKEVCSTKKEVSRIENTKKRCQLNPN